MTGDRPVQLIVGGRRGLTAPASSTAGHKDGVLVASDRVGLPGAGLTQGLFVAGVAGD